MFPKGSPVVFRVPTPRPQTAEAGFLPLGLMRRNELPQADLTADRRCLLRVAPARAVRDVTLRDGATVRKGAILLDLGLEAARLPRRRGDGPSAAWSHSVSEALGLSLSLLTDWMDGQRLLGPVRVVRATALFHGLGDAALLPCRFGFETLDEPVGPPLLGRWRQTRGAFISRRALFRHYAAP